MKTKLKQDYENACNNYLKAFCEKHEFDYEPDMWVANDVGTIICIGDYYVDMNTIRIDIDKDASVSEFVKWYDYYYRLGTLGVSCPSYDNWLRGCPIYSKEEIAEMIKVRIKVEEQTEFVEWLKKPPIY